MKERRMHAKYLNFFFKNLNDSPKKNENKLPLMKRSKTNKEMFLSNNNQEKSSKILVNNINSNFIFNQFNQFNSCASNENIKSPKKYINSLSELINNKSYYKRKKNLTIDNNLQKNNLIFDMKRNFLPRKFHINSHEAENIYSFVTKKIDIEKSQILKLKKKYKFFTLPKSLKDEIFEKKFEKIFNKKFNIDLKFKFKNKERILKRMKYHSLMEKLKYDTNDINNEEKSIYIIKKNNNKSNNCYSERNKLSDIETYINNNLRKKEYFNSFSSSELFNNKIHKSIQKNKYNIFLNYMKLKKTNKNSKFLSQNK